MLAASLLLAGCGDDEPDAAPAAPADADPVIDPGDDGDYAPELDPSDFFDEIDNPYLPFRAGARWVYEGTDEEGTERIEVTVTPERRMIEGISATVVRDTVTLDGELVEDTFDWYAQDRNGNVWYLGEDTTEYEGGEVVSTEGAWEAGVDGARAGVIMRADPAVGDAYRQEFYRGEAEDMAEVVRRGDAATVPAGSFEDLLTIKEWTPIEPEVVEENSFALGVGVVLEEKVAGGEGRIELIEHTPAAGLSSPVQVGFRTGPP
ncbi:hypothetical protein BH18ACT1_BH18ACT1_17110 [soil metagenome]